MRRLGRALWSSALALLAGTAAAAEPALSPDQALAREIYAELIGIDTTHAGGSSTRAAEAMAARLRAAGFAAADVEVLEPKPTKGNLVARLRGRGERRPILLLAHLDVVLAAREDWSVEPFALLERDGFFWGRGTLDDKAMAAIFVTLFLRLKQDGVTLARDVILALTADEESGSDNGAEWLLANRRERVDAALVLNEGGGGRMRAGRRLMNTIQVAEKTNAYFELVATDPGGHSSLPTPGNPIYRMAAALARLQAHAFPVELSEVTRAFVAASAKVESGALAADLEALLREPPDAGAVARLAQRPSYNAALRTTCVPTLAEAGVARNALPPSARVTLNCRILPGHTPEEVQQALAGVIADPQLSLRFERMRASAPASPLSPELLAAVERVTEELWPGVPVVPVMSPGASDSTHFRAAGIPAFGVSGLFSDVDDARMHGRDERLGVREFYDGLEFLTRLVRALAE